MALTEPQQIHPNNTKELDGKVMKFGGWEKFLIETEDVRPLKSVLCELEGVS